MHITHCICIRPHTTLAAKDSIVSGVNLAQIAENNKHRTDLMVYSEKLNTAVRKYKHIRRGSLYASRTF